MVPPRISGPAQGLLSVKWEFFLANANPGGFRLWVSASVKRLETIPVVKSAMQIKLN